MYTIREIVKQQMASTQRSQETPDFLDRIIGDMKTEQFVVQLLFGLLFVSFDSVSTTLSLAFKLLKEHPWMLHELIVGPLIQSVPPSISVLHIICRTLIPNKSYQDEHEPIRRSKEELESPITWNEYKPMSFSFQVRI